MILNFTVENYLSFKEPTTLSMVASRERQHSDRVASVSKLRTGVLPVSAVYGANASGKSNLYWALFLLRSLVTALPEKQVPIKPFLLGTSDKKPTKLTLEFLVDDKAYELYVECTPKAVIRERLTEVRRESEELLYDRQNDGINWGPKYRDVPELSFAFNGTKPRQSLLHNASSQNLDHFSHISEWFTNHFLFIEPNSLVDLVPYIKNETALKKATVRILRELNCGIDDIEVVETKLSEADLPDSVKAEAFSRIEEGKRDTLTNDLTGERIFVFNEDGEHFVERLVTYKNKEDGTNAMFTLQEHSDGTRRLLDLVWAFMMMADYDYPCVFVVDELDRSLHTSLSRTLIRSFLAACSKESRNQLIFTTHDLMLMDQSIFRRDEMNILERNNFGATKLSSIGDFEEVRKDKDIRKSYIEGRFGGTPNIDECLSLDV